MKTERPNPEVKPDPRLISYLERMPSGVGGYRSWRHLIHKWETIKNDPPHKYQICEVCGRRRIYTQHVGDMICYPDFGWLETGEWTKPSRAMDPFGADKSVVLPNQSRDKLKEASISVVSAWKNGYLFDPRFTMRMVAEKKLEMLESALRSEE